MYTRSRWNLYTSNHVYSSKLQIFSSGFLISWKVLLYSFYLRSTRLNIAFHGRFFFFSEGLRAGHRENWIEIAGQGI